MYLLLILDDIRYWKVCGVHSYRMILHQYTSLILSPPTLQWWRDFAASWPCWDTEELQKVWCQICTHGPTLWNNFLSLSYLSQSRISYVMFLCLFQLISHCLYYGLSLDILCMYVLFIWFFCKGMKACYTVFILWPNLERVLCIYFYVRYLRSTWQNDLDFVRCRALY